MPIVKKLVREEFKRSFAVKVLAEGTKKYKIGENGREKENINWEEVEYGYTPLLDMLATK